MAKSLLITGVSRGLGRYSSHEALERGLKVYGVGRNENDCDELIAKGLKFIPADLMNDQSILAIRNAIPSVDMIDILISNAGIPGRASSLEEITSKELSDLFEVHVGGAWRVTMGALHGIKNSNHPHLVYVSSRLGSTTRQFDGTFSHLQSSYSYRIAKAGLNMFAACVASEFPAARVSVVHPGRLKTDSGHSDANLLPEEAASRLLDFALHPPPKSLRTEIHNLDGEPFPF